MAEKSVVRELFIDELAQVSGGGPVDKILQRIPEEVRPSLPPTETTMACCEEGNDNCCA